MNCWIADIVLCCNYLPTRLKPTSVRALMASCCECDADRVAWCCICALNNDCMSRMISHLLSCPISHVQRGKGQKQRGFHLWITRVTQASTSTILWTGNPLTLKVHHSDPVYHIISEVLGCHWTHDLITFRNKDSNKAHSSWRQRLHFCKKTRQRFVGTQWLSSWCVCHIWFQLAITWLTVWLVGDGERVGWLIIENSKSKKRSIPFQTANLAYETLHSPTYSSHAQRFLLCCVGSAFKHWSYLRCKGSGLSQNTYLWTPA